MRQRYHSGNIFPTFNDNPCHFFHSLMFSHCRFKNETRRGEVQTLLHGVDVPSPNLCSDVAQLPASLKASKHSLPVNPMVLSEPEDFSGKAKVKCRPAIATGLANLRQHEDVPNNSIVVDENMIADG